MSGITDNDEKALLKEKKAFVNDKISDSSSIALLAYILTFIEKRVESDALLWVAVATVVGALSLLVYNLPKIMKVVSGDRKMKRKAIIRLVVTLMVYAIVFINCFVD